MADKRFFGTSWNGSISDGVFADVTEIVNNQAH